MNHVSKPILAVISQGCAANFGDGEKIARIFEEDYQVFFEMPDAEPDAFVLNVCTVKGNSGALKLLRDALQRAPQAKLFITGCAPKDFKDEVLKLTSKVTFTTLAELSKQGKPQSTLRQSPRVGIVNIEEGCLDACAYCSTRLSKGRLHSYDAKDIVKQTQNLVADGCTEIQLTGQDCGCYGFDKGSNLAELTQQILAQVPGNYRLRLGMGNPRHMQQYTDELLECFEDERVYKFIHLPVQSGSDQMLKSMNRKHSVQDYIDLAKAFCQKFPLFTLSTDLIVGFPGETEQDFLETMQVLQETRPTVCNITRFVPRPGTPAYHFEGQIPDEIKHQRSATLAEAFQQIALENNRRWIGHTERVVVEKAGYRKGTYIARNGAYRPVAITSATPLAPGTALTVTISDAEAFALKV